MSSVSRRKAPIILSEEGGASTPTAPEGVRALIILSCYCGRHVGGTLCETGDRSALDSTKVNRTARSASLENFWTCLFLHVDCALHHSRSSGPELKTRRDVLDSPRSVDHCARQRRDRKPSRRRPCRARGDRQGCTECRRFPPRAYTNVYHDRRRPEVAVAKHRHPLSSSRWVACSSSGSQVARRLPGRHSSVAASRCAAGLDFVFRRSTSGRPPPWCPQGGLLPAGSCWTLLS